MKNLTDVGGEEGYLSYDPGNDAVPSALGDVDGLLASIGTQGIDVTDEHNVSSQFEKKFDSELEAGEDVDLDLTPGVLDKTSDPVRTYLREMATVPLLSRQAEVEIAKRIESGQVRVLKAISRSPIIIQELIAIGDALKRGARSIKDLVIFLEEEITDDVLAERTQATIHKIDEMAKHHKKSQDLEQKLAGINRKKHPRAHRRCRWSIGRERVRVSRIIRSFHYTNPERKRLIEKVTKPLKLCVCWTARSAIWARSTRARATKSCARSTGSSRRITRRSCKNSSSRPASAFRSCAIRNARSCKEKWTRTMPNAS